MYKPLELPFRVRVWHFIRGLLFYNTVYWKRASDGLKPPKLSHQERLLHQPARNLEIIRPRENPRSNVGITRGAQVSVPSFNGIRPADNDTEFAPVTESAPEPVTSPVETEPVFELPSTEVVVKRRRYRRRRSKVGSSHRSERPAASQKNGLFAKLFGR